jgi:4-amino-4-deoxy-L-arabinose transferase-like glycosyltransferase
LFQTRFKINIDYLAFALTVFFAIFILWFGLEFHRIESVPSPEDDDYVERAIQLHDGLIPKDPHRPLLYPLLSAGAGFVLGDTFIGARLVSQISAAIFALMAYLLGRLFFDKKVGLFALGSVILNFFVVKSGVVAASDMLFSAWAMLTLFWAIRVSQRIQYSYIIILALFFSLAYFTRYTAIALAVPIAIALTVAPEVRPKQIIFRYIVFGAAVLVFLLPHFYLTIHVFGDPFYNENWRDLAFKLYGNGDWSYYKTGRMPFDGLASVIGHNPGLFIWSALEELARSLTIGLAKLTGNGNGLVGAPYAVLFFVGLYMILRFPNRKTVIIVSFIVTYFLMVNVFYVALNRIMLPVLPLCYAIVGHCIRGASDYQSPKAFSINAKWVIAGVISLILFVQGAVLVKRLDSFIRQHPTAEVNAARTLVTKHGTGLGILSTFKHLGNHVEGCGCFYLEEEFGKFRDDKAIYYEKIKAVIMETKAEYLIVGRASLRSRPEDLLINRDVPSFLSLVSIDENTAVYHVERP